MYGIHDTNIHGFVFYVCFTQVPSLCRSHRDLWPLAPPISLAGGQPLSRDPRRALMELAPKLIHEEKLAKRASKLLFRIRRVEWGEIGY